MNLKEKPIFIKAGQIPINMSNFDLKKYLAEGKLHKPTLNEFIGGELEKRNEVLYDKLVDYCHNNYDIFEYKSNCGLPYRGYHHHRWMYQIKNETLIGLKDCLSTITLNLPEGNSKIVGLYYQIFKRLAWDNVTLYEVISTTNEFTILIEDHLVDKAFSVIKGLKH